MKEWIRSPAAQRAVVTVSVLWALGILISLPHVTYPWDREAFPAAWAGCLIGTAALAIWNAAWVCRSRWLVARLVLYATWGVAGTAAGLLLIQCWAVVGSR